jgi:hypothetical protein
LREAFRVMQKASGTAFSESENPRLCVLLRFVVLLFSAESIAQGDDF